MKVSIHMPAYNHEAYVEQAVESVLRQQVRFQYEIVIGEDCSTDNTREVVRRLATAHPGVVKVLEHPRNLGIWDNDQAVIAACRGEYIAWLEADDYWTATDKLQRQVDLLEAHPDLSACFHRAGCKTDSIIPSTWRGGPPVVKQFYTVDDLLAEGHFIPSCTVVFRAQHARPALEWTRGTPFLERSYCLRFALAGKLGYIDEEMATYRFHGGGIYAAASALANVERAIEAHKLVGKEFGLQHLTAYEVGLARYVAASRLMTQNA